MRSFPALALASVLLLALGCDADSPPSGSGSGPPPPDPSVPSPPSGTVFDAAVDRPGEWIFVPTAGALCRDGSPTGLGFRYEVGAQDLLLLLGGGGVCFDARTCSNNRASYDENDFEATMKRLGEAGILSRAATNPVAGWNTAFVPYCTGDLHGGTISDVRVDGVPSVQQFVGHRNVELYLDQLEPFVLTPRRVLVAGGSAGGYGTLLAFDDVARRFPNSELFLLNDSGPFFFDDAVFSPNLGTTIESLFRLSQSVPEAALFQPDGLQTVYAHYAQTYPEATFALASYTDDPTIRDYLAAGQPDGQITSAEYAGGVRDLSARLPAEWHTYVAEGEGHVFIAKNGGYAGARSPNVSAWLGDLLNGRGNDVEASAP
ncbi:MAG: pectin acetylesterase-family hydrolase [Bacteroidota bacterium]